MQDSTALRRFVGIDLGRERVPDATTLLKFRRLLERPELGAEERVYGDSAYASQEELIASKAPQAEDCTNQRVRQGSATEDLGRILNRLKSRVRSRVEPVFAVLKRLWGFAKVRYRGLAKNATRAFVATSLANLYLARQRLMA